jgi:hypothetical protein
VARTAWAGRANAPTAAALDPMLIEHRDMMYRERLVLPLSL